MAEEPLSPHPLTPHQPLLQRHGLEVATEPAPWIHPPAVLRSRLIGWAKRLFDSNLSPIYNSTSVEDEYYYNISDIGINFATSLQLDLPSHCSTRFYQDMDGDYVPAVSPDPSYVLKKAVSERLDTSLDVIDFMLCHKLLTSEEIGDIQKLLDLSGSAWMVSQDTTKLMLRLSIEEQSEAQRTIDHATSSALDHIVSAGRHLQDAHKYAWHRGSMNAQAAYQSAVMAIESSLRETVMPGQSHARLGHIAKELRIPKHQWQIRLGGQDAVEQLATVIDFLAVDHDKHGQVTYQVNDIKEAQDAVTLATAIVGLTERGFLTRGEQTQAEPLPQSPNNRPTSSSNR